MKKMITLSTKNNTLLSLIIPLLILSVSLIISLTEGFIENTAILSKAITLDLLILMPCAFFLFVRKSKLPNTSTVPVFIIGLVAGYLIIPKEHQTLLIWFKSFVLPAVELSVFLFVIYKVYKTLKSIRLKQKNTPDFFDALNETCQDIFPNKLAKFLAMEIAVFYYGFIYWKKYKIQKDEFTYHKSSGTIGLFFAFILILSIETYVLHLLIESWNVTIAWILSLISIYTTIQIFGFIKSILKRPIYIKDEILYLRYGILSHVKINFEAVQRIELTSRDIKENKGTIKLSILGDLESHNIIIHLSSEHELTGFYGIKKKFTSIAISIDQKEEFIKTLGSKRR